MPQSPGSEVVFQFLLDPKKLRSWSEKNTVEILLSFTHVLRGSAVEAEPNAALLGLIRSDPFLEPRPP